MSDPDWDQRADLQTTWVEGPGVGQRSSVPGGGTAPNGPTAALHAKFGNARVAKKNLAGPRAVIADQSAPSTEMPRAHPSNVVQRQPATSAIDVDVISQLSEYRNPQTGIIHRLGENAATSVLTRIESAANGLITFHWFNFSRGQTGSGSPADWELRQAAGSTFNATSPDFADLGRQMSPQEWRQFGENPSAELLRRFEASQIHISEKAFPEIHRGMIFAEGQRTLAANEAQIDALLDAPGELQRLREYAETLKEASQVRDAIVSQFLEIKIPLRPQILAEIESENRDKLEKVYRFWMSCFPLLSRLQTAQITPERLEGQLREIKSSIVATREQLDLAAKGRGSFDLNELDAVRAHVDPSLGPRAQERIASEEASQKRWAWLHMGASLGGMTALIFLPGGQIVAFAIGLGMTLGAWDRARTVGKAASSGLNADEGLMSRVASASAETQAVLATILALLPVGFHGLRALTGGRMLLRVRAVAPKLALTSQMRVSRTLAGSPDLVQGLRSTAEIDALLAEHGIALSAEELVALRATTHHLQAATLEAQSRASLRQFLSRIWQNRGQMQSARSVYQEYSTAIEANPLTRPTQAYTDDVLALRYGRSSGSRYVEQGRYFHHFYRAGAGSKPLTQRIYINSRADQAPDVMRRIVREVVDNPKEFPGVVGAKVAGATEVSGRPETIVIYLENEAATARVLARVRAIQGESPMAFNRSTPPMTNPVFRGVSTAAEPPWAGTPVSFGESRSNVIFEALEQAKANRETESQFFQRVLEGMRRAGFNPDAPHTNLPL